ADAAGAFAAAMSGTVGGIDVGYLGDRHFLNVGGIGFDAAIADSFNRSARRGGLGYVGRVLQMVWSYTPERYRVILEGQIRDATAFLLVFANGREYGNNMVIAPDADPTDGWLDMAVADDAAPLPQFSPRGGPPQPEGWTWPSPTPPLPSVSCGGPEDSSSGNVNRFPA